MTVSVMPDTAEAVRWRSNGNVFMAMTYFSTYRLRHNAIIQHRRVIAEKIWLDFLYVICIFLTSYVSDIVYIGYHSPYVPDKREVPVLHEITGKQGIFYLKARSGERDIVSFSELPA
jgi:hypothetical protein